MKLLFKISIIFVLLLFQNGFSQRVIQTKLPDTISHWERKNVVGIDISQIAFMNWNAGGNSSVSALLKGNFIRKYSNKNMRWLNEVIIRYGINKQDGVDLRKTDDAFQANSTFGYRRDTLSNWFYSAKFNFNTQFTNGFAYPNTEKAISKLFAPAYIFTGIGAEYANKEKKITVYVSPVTQKTTLVLDENLANQGAFGVQKAIIDSQNNVIKSGRRTRTELGILLTSAHKKEVWKNINLDNRLSLYSDYINNFGNIDIDWQMQLDLIVNEHVRANIGAHLIYDDDIKAKEEIGGNQVTVGPKVQLKQMLGIGLIYNFK
jgi:hypothetical protein